MAIKPTAKKSADPEAMLTPHQQSALARLRSHLAHVDPKQSLSDEIADERREEAQREDEEVES
jgi:hypothetical protein